MREWSRNAICLLRFRLVGSRNFAFKEANINTAVYALYEIRGKVFAEPTKKQAALKDGLKSHPPLMRFLWLTEAANFCRFVAMEILSARTHPKTNWLEWLMDE